MSKIQGPMSNFQCPMSSVECPVRNVQCPMSTRHSVQNPMSYNATCLCLSLCTLLSHCVQLYRQQNPKHIHRDTHTQRQTDRQTDRPTDRSNLGFVYVVYACLQWSWHQQQLLQCLVTGVTIQQIFYIFFFWCPVVTRRTKYCNHLIKPPSPPNSMLEKALGCFIPARGYQRRFSNFLALSLVATLIWGRGGMTNILM